MKRLVVGPFHHTFSMFVVPLRTRLLIVLTISALACTPTSPVDRSGLSRDLTTRTGHGLREKAAPDHKSPTSRIPPGIIMSRPLHEDDMVAIALWNNAAFQADLASLGVARADLIDAGMIRNPLLTLFLPMGPRQLEFTASLPIEALWQRGRRVDVARLDVERVAGGLVQNGLDLVRNVKLAFAELTLAEDRARLSLASAELRGRIAQIAEARLRAGDLSQLEVGTARVDARQAEEESLHANHQVKAARVALRTWLGLERSEDTWTAALDAPEPREATNVDASIKKALALRPDLRAAEIAIEAAGARLGWEKTKIIPNLAVSAKGSGVSGDMVVGPGFALEIPIFNQNQGPRARAHADIEKAIWIYAAVRHRVVEEVEAAQLQYDEAQAALALLRGNILPLVDENVRRAEKAYQGGDAAYLVVLEATRQLLDARRREVEAVASLRRASVHLDRSVGGKLVQK